MVSVLRQRRLQWCGHVLRREDGGWMRACVECGVRMLGREVDQRKLGK